MTDTMQPRVRDSSPAKRTPLCEVCERTGQCSSFCVPCDSNLCDKCWTKQIAHRPGKSGADGGLPHEKSDYEVVMRLKKILEPAAEVEVQQTLHKEDEDTTWFGVVRDTKNNPIFQDYGRYTAIMAGSLSTQWGERFPQLVSFIGQTGAGKSTLVKMLIEFIGGPPDKSVFPSPIVGSANDNVPTSGDVHLYADPPTHYGKQPMLYADCEGLEGGENVPRSVRLREIEAANSQTQKFGPSSDTTFRQKLQKLPYKRRDIVWANSPETRKREFAVTQLYPRLLYTFSDVVVFVLRNSRTFESAVLHKLLDWALKSLEKSLNQFALPHAIIVLNATDNSVNVKQWDMTEATRTLFADVDEVLHRDDKFDGYKQFWQARGKTINSIKDLLESFYSTITVIRIPAKPGYMRIRDQLEKLHQRITVCCNNAYRTRMSVRMLSNADDLHTYLQCAFDHFSKNLDAPFNFVEVSLRNNPIPLDFGGNILKLAIAIKDRTGRSEGRGIFQELSQMVASCIFLDLVRHRLKGTAEELLDKHYLQHCDFALHNFCNIYWHCQFSNNQGVCVNVKVGHSKGHQNDRGRVIAPGSYQSDFTTGSFLEEWHKLLKKEVIKQSQSVKQTLQSDSSISEEKAVGDLHFQVMQRFYRGLGSAAEFLSHSTCLCCLRELPEHPLRCGHVLCTPCIHTYSSSRKKSSIAMDECPLHAEETAWRDPWVITIKPPLAGVRVLCLDGGGIRGIVELEVLAEIERALGGKIPIQAFFDLIVGTSTGGIIALGLGVKEWPVETVIDKFVSLCDKAFTPREFHRIPGIRYLTTVNHGSKYKTRPFEKILQEHFKEECLFGGQRKDDRYATKVAVTSTTDTGQQATVLSNYNRQHPEEQGPDYKFERPNQPEYELKIWEAARATSAAPPYFKQFVNDRTGRGYLDGALYHNNPVRIANHERKLLWPDAADYPPDVLLSIGTGCRQATKDGSNATTTKGVGKFSNSLNQSPLLISRERSKNREGAIKRTRGHPRLLETLLNRVDSILDCDRAWTGFLVDAYKSSQPGELRRRYQRVDFDLGVDLPRLDEKDKLGMLQVAVREKLKGNPEARDKVKVIARQLVASSFYFDKNAIPPIEDDGICRFLGQIRCRFPGATEELREIGRFLQREQISEFQPHFAIGGRDPEGGPAQRVDITRKHINDMIEFAKFDMEQICIPVLVGMEVTTIELCLRDDVPIPISGFPRKLMVEDPLKFSRGILGPRRRSYETKDKQANMTSQDDSQRVSTRRAHQLRSTSSNPDLQKHQRFVSLPSLGTASESKQDLA